MEELINLRELVASGNIAEALLLIEELEEMGKKGITRIIRSYARVLLLHLIKQQVEQRTTKSWQTSIRNSVREIKDANARPKGKGNYLDNTELREIIIAVMDSAVDEAANQCCNGELETRQIEKMINKNELIDQVYKLVEVS